MTYIKKHGKMFRISLGAGNDHIHLQEMEEHTVSSEWYEFECVTFVNDGYAGNQSADKICSCIDSHDEIVVESYEALCRIRDIWAASSIKSMPFGAFYAHTVGIKMDDYVMEKLESSTTLSERGWAAAIRSWDSSDEENLGLEANATAIHKH